MTYLVFDHLPSPPDRAFRVYDVVLLCEGPELFEISSHPRPLFFADPFAARPPGASHRRRLCLSYIRNHK